MDKFLEVVDKLVLDTDKHKQRAGAEILVGVLRGKLSWQRWETYNINMDARIKALGSKVPKEVMDMDYSSTWSCCFPNKTRNNILLGVDLSGERCFVYVL